MKRSRRRINPANKPDTSLQKAMLQGDENIEELIRQVRENVPGAHEVLSDYLEERGEPRLLGGERWEAIHCRFGGLSKQEAEIDFELLLNECSLETAPEGTRGELSLLADLWESWGDTVKAAGMRWLLRRGKFPARLAREGFPEQFYWDIGRGPVYQLDLDEPITHWLPPDVGKGMEKSGPGSVAYDSCFAAYLDAASGAGRWLSASEP